MLGEKESVKILSLFPNIKLSYENFTHKKVQQCDFVYAIPDGKKYFVWFSKNERQQNICIFMEVTKDKQIAGLQVECIDAKSASLCNGKGTIFYGTIFSLNADSYFAIENIFFEKGRNISNLSVDKKILATYHILSSGNLNNILYSNSVLTFGFPLIYPEFNQDMNLTIRNLPYKVAQIQFYNIHKPNNYYVMNYMYNSREINPHVKSSVNQNRIENKDTRDTRERNHIVFKVKPDLQNDIYHLYVLDNYDKETLYNTAYISDYKTSVMMNGLFRNIKENINLDALEESDDDEEFENDKIDKFVDLQKSYKMDCIFNHKFKKWCPIKIAQLNSELVRKNDLIRLEKNKY